MQGTFIAEENRKNDMASPNALQLSGQSTIDRSQALANFQSFLPPPVRRKTLKVDFGSTFKKLSVALG